MTVSTITCGYPVHRVVRYATRTNVHGLTITDWTAGCGHTDAKVGINPFSIAGHALKTELCQRCFDNGMHGYYPDPVCDD